MKTTYVVVSFSISMDRAYSYKKFVRILSAQNWLKEQLQSPVVDFISIRKVRNPDEADGNNHPVLRPYF